MVLTELKCETAKTNGLLFNVPLKAVKIGITQGTLGLLGYYYGEDLPGDDSRNALQKTFKTTNMLSH